MNLDLGLPRETGDVLRSFYRGGMHPFQSSRPSPRARASAERVLRRAARLWPRSWAVRVAQSAFWCDCRDVERALRCAREAVALGPREAWPYLARFRAAAQAVILEKLHGRAGPGLSARAEEALADLRRAEEAGGAAWPAFLGRVFFLNAIDRHEWLDEALLRPFADLAGEGLAVFHAACGLNLSGRERLDEALIHARKTRRLLPRLGWARALEARILAKAGRIDDAARLVEQALKSLPREGELRAWLGEASRRRGDYAQALRHLAEAVRLDPGCDNAFLWLGQTRLALGRLRAAARDFTRCLELSAMHVQKARACLGQVSLKLGNWPQALRDFDAAFPFRSVQVWSERLTPRGLRDRSVSRQEAMADDLRRAAPLLRGRLRVEHEEDLGPACEDLSRAARLDPASAPARAWRGLALEKLGERAGAAADCRAAVRLDPSYAPGRLFLGRLEAACGNLEPALRHLSAAARLGLHAGPVLAAKAQALWAAGRRREALEAARDALWLNYRGSEIEPFRARLGPP